MSLVVAGISGSGGIHAVAETKLTWTDDPERTRHVWSEPWRKLLVLRADLMVGITGSGYLEACQHLVSAARHGTPDQVAWAAADLSGSDVIVASLDPVQLVRSRFGVRSDETARGRAWAGDEEAYEKFQRWEAPVFGGIEDLGLQAPMQTLANLDQHGSVGGYTLRVDTSAGEFHFSPTPMTIFGVVTACVVAGRGSTPGAIGIHLPGAAVGYLYSQSAPWEPIELQARTCDALVASAFESFGQELLVAGTCGTGGTAS